MAGLSIDIYFILGMLVFCSRLRTSFGNLVLTPDGDYNAESGQTFKASICLSAGSQQRFTLEYVSVSSSNVLYVIQESQNGQQGTGGSCQGTIHTYVYDLTYIDHPSLVGQSVKLRVTTQSPSFSAVSSGAITFTALYSLSGSSIYATLGQDYTWTCDTSGEKPSGVSVMYICWYRGGYQSAQKVGCSTYQSGSCQTEDNDPRYNFGCNSNVYTLTIPSTNMDESEQKSMWRCVNGFRSITTSPSYTSPFKELSLAIPVLNVTLLPSSIASMENVTTTIQCLPNSNANPQPTIMWYKDGVDITNQATTDRKTITLSFTRADKGKILRCTVTGLSTSINASTTIDVIYPPLSDPGITGYNGSALQEGDGTVTVTCRQEGGNPVANMTFVCQGNGGTVTPSGNAVTSSHTLTINRSLDKQTCTCTTSHSAGNYQRTVTKTFIVHYPPEKPTIQLSAPYPWKSGDNRRLTCTTSGGNPTEYNFTWIEGATIIHIGQQLNFPSLSSSDNNRQLSCQVDNAYRGGPIRSDSTMLQVQYPPTSDPVITGYDGSPLQEGDGTITVTCRQEGGNPAANMTFVCQGNAGTVTTSGNVVTSSHTLTINRSLDKQTCTCMTSHSVRNYQRTLTKQFIVYYPPQKPTIQLSAPYPWKSGDNRRLTCTTSGGNPTVYNFTWIEGATIIHIGQQFNFPSLTSDDNDRRLSCQVDNDYRGGPIRSDSTTLQVEYDPQVQVDTSSTDVIEGRSFTRTCTATGNPTPTVRWYKAGGTWITQPQLSSSTLTFININRTDTGEYVCQATAQSQGNNVLQPDRKSFNLTVLFPPDVKVDLSGTNVNAAEVNLTCSANGVPNIYTYHGWEQHFRNQQIRNADELSTLTIEGGRILRLRNVTYDDMGEYRCSVNNSVPDRNGIYIKAATSLLDVKAAATFLTDTKIFQQRFHANLTVMFEIYANPTVSSVIWKNGSRTIINGNDISISTMNKVINFPWHTKSIMVNGTQIAMEIVSFKKTHIGNYSVIVKNENYGEMEKSFEIDVSGPPEAPEKFHIVQKTETSLTITWTKMLNGGHAQTFFIFLQKSGEAANNYERQLSIIDMDKKDSYNVTFNNLSPDTNYIIWLYAGNIEGNTSALNSPINGSTNVLDVSDASQSSATIGAVSGVCAAVVVIVVVVVVVILKRRSSAARSKGSKQQLCSSSKDVHVREDAQDGIKDNILYVSADETFDSKSPANAAVYAEVSKPKSKKKGTPTEANPENLYSEVKKPKKKGKKGAESKSKMAQGDVYENVSVPNAGIQESSFSENQARGYKNEDGLLYVDVQIKPSTNQGRNVIIGEEDRTDYASVDFVFPETGK